MPQREPHQTHESKLDTRIAASGVPGGVLYAVITHYYDIGVSSAVSIDMQSEPRVNRYGFRELLTFRRILRGTNLDALARSPQGQESRRLGKQTEQRNALEMNVDVL